MHLGPGLRLRPGLDLRLRPGLGLGLRPGLRLRPGMDLGLLPDLLLALAFFLPARLLHLRLGPGLRLGLRVHRGFYLRRRLGLRLGLTGPGSGLHSPGRGRRRSAGSGGSRVEFPRSGLGYRRFFSGLVSAPGWPGLVWAPGWNCPG